MGVSHWVGLCADEGCLVEHTCSLCRQISRVYFILIYFIFLQIYSDKIHKLTSLNIRSLASLRSIRRIFLLPL